MYSLNKFFYRLTAFLSLSLFTLLFFHYQAAAQGTRLLRQPDVNSESVVFTYANDLWVASRDGGEARRLTSFEGTENHPHFSPDGSMIAFSGEYDGNTDVYTVPAEGGSPTRLTWHPGADRVEGWTPEGDSILFVSGRKSAPVGYDKFFTVSTEGGKPKSVAIPRGTKGAYSKDGRQFAYQPVELSDKEWRNYRGGQIRPIWLMDLNSKEITKLPWKGQSRNTDPVWLGDDIFFLSDRDYAVNLYQYNTANGELSQLTEYSKFDAKELNAGGGLLAYEHAGYIHTFNPQTGEEKQLTINVKGDLSWARPGYKDVGDDLRHPALSPSGVRAVFEGRGEIFTVPTEKGDTRNLSHTPGAADRNPVWSPDGQKIAWFSDENGEYQLKISGQKGLEKPETIEIEQPSFFYTPRWSPDSKYICFTDADLNLWYINVKNGNQVKVDQDQFAHPQRTMDPAWSPDSKWIAYTKRLDNQFHAIMVYSMEENKTYQVTDGMSDAISPAWDKSGNYLYFLSSTNFALNTGWLDMSSYERPIRRSIYMAVLEEDQPSPLLPESDEEEVPTEGKTEETKESKQDSTVSIDFKGITNRIISLEVPSRHYTRIMSAGEGEIFFSENVENQPGLTLHKYTLKEQKQEPFLQPVMDFNISADGKKLIYQSGSTWGVVATSGSPSVGDGKLNTDIETKIDPRKEWRQIYEEAWRFQRDYFYVDNMHGADWDAVYEKYKDWVDHVGHRADLNYILDIMGGELSVGHSFVGGGDYPEVERINIGLLGADYTIDDNRYRISKIYDGENWNPDLRAPLSAPGIDLSEGDYLLAVNGKELTAGQNPYKLFEATAGKQTIITVNDEPKMEGARRETVVPVRDEGSLRRKEWVEANRRRVEEMSDGRLAYVWLPNTAWAGYTYFNRYYFSQQHKQGVVIDERFNSGGSAADYMIDIMSRELHGFFNNPIDKDKPFTSPGAGIWGPKVMIINEKAGSGGDYLPYMFRKEEIGPLVGRTTWGGLVGIWDVPQFIDGGAMTSPRGGFYNTNGEWDVENEGVAPDIKVEMTPKKVLNGHDPQLERAVEEALKLLEDYEKPIHPQPEGPERSKYPKRD